MTTKGIHRRNHYSSKHARVRESHACQIVYTWQQKSTNLYFSRVNKVTLQRCSDWRYYKYTTIMTEGKVWSTPPEGFYKSIHTVSTTFLLEVDNRKNGTISPLKKPSYWWLSVLWLLVQLSRLLFVCMCIRELFFFTRNNCSTPSVESFDCESL